ncbi:PIR Superfamily Protein [Plasmodium ovale curtisi]|uniref:PIR Superfamily Protein n=1 Tax=Plasmodium ovale curtisi TaxID=864141 RepID=A0A1A8WMA5_PLAOA|nr:PIR Superfamily Protein [Plasmodium ovale curtisi]SBT02575.1 PIR Superfamily Protein [Plasmodium ovale curtisi]
MALLKENEWEEKLQDLPAYKIYNEFNREENTPDYKDFCKSLGLGDVEAERLCEKTSRILKELSSISISEEWTKRCHYFQHWFYDQIRKKFSTGDNNIARKPIANKLFRALEIINSKYSLNRHCLCYSFRKVEELKEEKDLHDYFKNHSSINCNDSDINRCEKYHDYVTYIKKSYDYFNVDEECCFFGNNLDDTCRHYFKCENDYNPSDLLAKLNEEIEKLKKKSEKADKGLTTEEALNPSSVKIVSSMSPPLEDTKELRGTKGFQESVKCADFSSKECPPKISEELIRAPPLITGVDRVAVNFFLNDEILPRGDTRNSVIPATRDIQAQETANLSSIAQSEFNILDTPSLRNGLTVSSIIGTVLFFYLYFRSRSCGFFTGKKAKKKEKYKNYYYEMRKGELSSDDLESVYIYTPSNRLYMSYYQARNSELIPHTVHYDLE